MTHAELGDGLIFEDLLRIAFTAGPLPSGAAAARCNVDNHQLLSAESSLDDVRTNEALKDESPALVHELQRLEFKLNILLRLTAELAARNETLPEAHVVRLSSHGMEWCGEPAPHQGETGVVSLYINPALPQPLRLPVTVIAERDETGVHVAVLRFEALSDAVTDLLEKLVFRHHRRRVAGTRHTPP